MNKSPLPHPGPKERRLLEALRGMFVGARADGRSGYINLTAIRAAYFERAVEPALREAATAALAEFPASREELFDRLHAFFGRHFSRSGSICFASPRQPLGVSDRVSTDEQDVVLSWKTHMLYYVKTDRLFRDMRVEVDGSTFLFDCAAVQHKKANEKRDLVFDFAGIGEDGAIRLTVTYLERGRRTRADDILEALRKADRPVPKGVLEKALRAFARQGEVDHFLNKDARGFLREQLDLWMYQSIYRAEARWTEARIRQLQGLKAVATGLIDSIGRFEDELVRLWNKPKFVRDAHYVVTLGRIAGRDGGPGWIAAALEHEGMRAQLAEWRALGVTPEGFDPRGILEERRDGQLQLSEAWRYLPLDTRHVKPLEAGLLALFDDLDEELDGRLIKGDNYQALRMLGRRYARAVDAVYVDPPYNTGTGRSEFPYVNHLRHASWLTFIENRFTAALPLLRDDGIFCVTIDDYEHRRLACFFDSLAGLDALGTAVIRNKPQGRPTASGFSVNHEYALFYGKKGRARVGRLPREGRKADRYGQSDADGIFAWANLRKTGSGSARGDRPRQFYPIYVRGGALRIPRMEWQEPSREWRVLEPLAEGEELVLPIDDDGKERVWNLSPDRVLLDLKDLRVVRGDRGTRIQRKYRPNDAGALPGTWWDDTLYSASESGTKMLRDILGEASSFSYPKSVYAVRDCLRVAGVGAKKEALVLDFFAGSGTTAHAVLLLNREDGGRRKFLVAEVGSHFEDVILPRLKKLAFCASWSGAEPVADVTGNPLFLKYYSLEQYEDALDRAVYADDPNDLVHGTSSDFNRYILFRDPEVAGASGPDEGQAHPNRLYPDIDLAETLSLMTGRPIKTLAPEEVVFTDGHRQSLTEPDRGLLEPLLFRGPVA